MKTTQIVILLLLVFVTCASFAQVSTGTPPFGSFSGGPDVINLGNLNVHLSMPVLAKPGRGMSVRYSLGYDSLVYTPGSLNGSLHWLPATNWGWTGNSEPAIGYISYSAVSVFCAAINGNVMTYSNWAYHDGAAHPFSGTAYSSAGCGPTSFPATANDGSGFSINVTNTPSATVTARDGRVIHAPLQVNTGSGWVTDSNGNQISIGIVTTGTQIVDTLNWTALFISGSSPNPVSLTYPDTAGTNRSVVVSYVAYTVATAFGCSTPIDYGPNSVNLVDRVTYPDGTFYQFSYEPTPGSSSNFTGRIAKITLPTGGTIAYSYTGANGGINCADGTTTGLTRTTVNADGTNEVTTYTRSVSGSTWTTVVNPPDGNQTAINFQQESTTGNFYETGRTSYLGSASQNPPVVIGSSTTCYNGAAPPNCNAAFSLPISRLTAYATLANNFESETDTYYNGNGLITEVDEYDFGTTANTVGSLLRKTLTAYNTSLGSIVDHPSSVTVEDASNSIKSQTTFSYDQTSVTATGAPEHVAVSGPRGNATTITNLLVGGTSPSTTLAYDDTGNVISTTDPGGHTTGFAYSSTYASAYLTQTTMPNTGVAHVVSSAYDIHTGLKTSDTDQNGNVTSYTYDSMLRPLLTTRPDGGTTSYTYFIPGSSWTYAVAYQQVAINSTSATGHYIMFDGYGRTQRALSSSGESNPWNQVDTSYDRMGRVSFVSYPYQGSGFGTPKVISGAGDSYAYGLAGTGGPLPTGTFTTTITHADSTSATTDVYARTTRATDESGKQRLSMVDGLGRLTNLCEVSSTPLSVGSDSPSGCGQEISATGFLTTYDYDILGNLLHTHQGSQTRTFTYDSLSRLLSSTAPESGTTSNTYDPDGNVSTRTRPAPNQTGSGTVTTTYAYDALNRLTQKSYNDGVTLKAYYYYDEYVGSVGHLTSDGTYNGSPWQTAANYQYDVMGRLNSVLDYKLPFAYGSYRQTTGVYDYVGNLTQYNDTSSHIFNYTYNQAGHLTSMTSNVNDSAHPGTLFSNVHYGPFGISSAHLGSGTDMSYGYTSRGMFQSKSATGTYSVSTNHAPNGNVAAVNDSINGSWSYSYDDFNRLSAASKTGTSLTYDYDRYGNRWHQNWVGSGTSPSYSFNSNNNQITNPGFTYDAAGNMTNDTFHTYTYDAENRVISVDSGTWTYIYDALGRRVQRKNGANQYDAIYDLAGKLNTEFYNNGGVTGIELYAGGMHLATYANSLTLFHFTDWLGSERMNTDASGSSQEICTGLPFGDGKSCTGPAYASNLFTDDVHDYESNTEHTDFRQLATTQGRWLSPDPAGMDAADLGDPQSLNMYAYAGSDPVDNVDPSGLDPINLGAIFVGLPGGGGITGGFIGGPFGSNPLNFGQGGYGGFIPGVYIPPIVYPTAPTGPTCFANLNSGVCGAPPPPPPPARGPASGGSTSLVSNFASQSNPFNTQGSFGLQAISIGDSLQGMFTGNWAQVAGSFENNTLGQTAAYANSPERFSRYVGYYGTRGALTGAGIAATTAGGLIAADGLGISSIGEFQISEWGGTDVGYWLNQGQYWRIGWGKDGGYRVFRAGGRIIRFFRKSGKIDFFRGPRL